MAEDNKRFFKATLLVGVCTFISNILGLLRSTLISAIYGATTGGGLADAYTAAFKLPDIIYTLVGSGIIPVVLIPYFLTVMKSKDREELNRACSGLLNIFFMIISVFIGLGIIFAPYIVKNFLLTGWKNSSEANILLTINMSRIILIQVFFFTLSSVFGSYLNALEKFTAYAFAMLSYNVGILIGILVLAPFVGIEGVAWGVAFGGFLHFAIQLSGSIRNGFGYSVVLPKMDSNLKTMSLNGVPRIVTLGVEQVARFFFVNFSSFLITGSIMIFSNVENIALVPYGLIAMSISTTAFPIFIKYYNAGDFKGLYESLFEKIRMLLFFLLPVCVFMFIFKNEVVDILVGYRNYKSLDVSITGQALGWYVLGIPFFSMTLVIVKFYYAQVRSIIPMIIALVSVTLTLVLCYFLSKTYAVSGLSMGRSIGYFVQAALLIAVLAMLVREKQRVSSISFKPLFDLVKIAGICVAVFVVCFILKTTIRVSPNFKLNSIVTLGISFVVAAPAYFGIASALKIPEARLITRRKAKTVAPKTSRVSDR
jgi:putative peptidoglycan lipid II flippase